MIRFIFKILLLFLISITAFSMPPQEPAQMKDSKELSILQKIIEETAIEKHAQIDKINWSYSPKNEITASIFFRERKIKIEFSREEILSIQNGKPPSSALLKKIEEAVSLMPTKNPPPEMPR